LFFANRGRLCREWSSWDQGRRHRYIRYRKDDTFELELPGRFTHFVARRDSGGFDK